MLNAKAIGDTEIYFIRGSILSDIPIIRIKLLETYEKRKELILHPEFSNIPVFVWRDDYCVNIEEMDNQHKELFKAANDLYDVVSAKPEKSVFWMPWIFSFGILKFIFRRKKN
ncbi:MAG: hypothetical protein OMM_06895 [Candidatus Magnetoglobus multicellularis str. Araruama]|uniref:Uncharacterized protein n=1 Tax=Candidatus Magnetoglobus multicellularis str. Araruama TaxID=890399 RepID=A0A1V1PEY7_9BACT|nr:MAG: hypothetical protein OMM_06895 [Candidatus Magnetoglobus multicellularis str. Araruama]